MIVLCVDLEVRDEPVQRKLLCVKSLTWFEIACKIVNKVNSYSQNAHTHPNHDPKQIAELVPNPQMLQMWRKA